MDNLTHSLVGIALSRVYFKRRVVFATTAMVVAANLPDLDLLYSWPGIRFLQYHRGILHSVWMLPVWALLVALALRWLAVRRNLAPPALWMGFALGLVGVGSHLLLDWSGSFGVRLLAPFNEHWFALDWAPFFDPWIGLFLAAFLGFPMLLSLISQEVGATRKNPHRLAAVLGLVAVAAWFGLRARQHAAALDLLNQPNVSGLYEGQLPYDWGAFPSSSPYQWQAVVSLPNNVLVAEVSSPWNEALGHVRLVRNFLRPPQVPAIANAEDTALGRTMLWFARFPFADDQDDGTSSIVTITDMRYAQGPVRPPIRAEIRMDGSLHIVHQSFRWPGWEW